MQDFLQKEFGSILADRLRPGPAKRSARSGTTRMAAYQIGAKRLSHNGRWEDGAMPPAESPPTSSPMDGEVRNLNYDMRPHEASKAANDLAAPGLLCAVAQMDPTSARSTSSSRSSSGAR